MFYLVVLPTYVALCNQIPALDSHSHHKTTNPYFLKSFIPSTMKLLNNLRLNIRLQDKFDNFIRKLLLFTGKAGNKLTGHICQIAVIDTYTYPEYKWDSVD